MGYSPSGRYLKIGENVVDLATDHVINRVDLFSPDEARYVFYDREDGSLGLYSPSNPEPLKRIFFKEKSYDALYANYWPLNAIIVGLDEVSDNLFVLSWKDLSILKKASMEMQFIHKIIVHPDGSGITLVGYDEFNFYDKDLTLVKTLNPKAPYTGNDEGDGYQTFEWNPSGTMAATTSTGTVILVDRETFSQKLTIKFPAPADGHYVFNHEAVNWFPDGKNLFIHTRAEADTVYYNLNVGTRKWTINPIQQSFSGFFDQFYTRNLEQEFGEDAFFEDWEQELDEYRLGLRIHHILVRNDFHQLVVDQEAFAFIFDIEEPQVVAKSKVVGIK